jgi:hypothetical protein
MGIFALSSLMTLSVILQDIRLRFFLIAVLFIFSLSYIFTHKKRTLSTGIWHMNAFTAHKSSL